MPLRPVAPRCAAELRKCTSASLVSDQCRADNRVHIHTKNAAIMEDLTVKSSGYDFGAAHAALRRYVDGNILSGVSSAVLVGRDLVDLHCVGWADREAQTPLRVDHIFRVFSNTKPR
jgi:hypothetical protein